MGTRGLGVRCYSGGIVVETSPMRRTGIQLQRCRGFGFGATFSICVRLRARLIAFSSENGMRYECECYIGGRVQGSSVKGRK